VLFDFDGTLSLLREGWPQVMNPDDVRLRHTGPSESEVDLGRPVEEFVKKKKTCSSPAADYLPNDRSLADEVRRPCGTRSIPLIYQARYHDLPWSAHGRSPTSKRARLPLRTVSFPAAIACWRASPRAVGLYLASGTDLSRSP